MTSALKSPAPLFLEPTISQAPQLGLQVFLERLSQRLSGMILRRIFSFAPRQPRGYKIDCRRKIEKVMFRPLSMLASRLPNAILWTVEPNSLTEPYFTKEKQAQFYTNIQRIQQHVVRQILSPPKLPTPLKN